MKIALICIGAGNSQYPVIFEAKKLGYAIIAIDRNPSAPGFNISDEIINLSTFDADLLFQPIEKLSNKYKITGILNRSSGPPVITAAKLARQLKIPCYPEKSANTIVNKHLLMKACSNIGIPAPESYSIARHDKLYKTEFQYPCIVKPSLSLIGKKGVTIVNKENDLKNAMNYAFSHTKNNYIEIDEFIDGNDILLIGFVNERELVHVCLMDELNSQDLNQKIYGKGSAIPSIYNSSKLKNEIEIIAKKIIRQFKIERSPLIISFRVDNDQIPKLIEIHLDLGGDLLIEKLFPKALKFNFLEYSIRLLAGEHPSIINNNIKPTAIIFERGDNLVSEKKNIILQAKNRLELDALIHSGIV